MEITRKNYFEILDKFGVKNLPRELQEGHSYVEQATENNSDWTIYNEGGNVKKVIDKHFAFIADFLSRKSSASSPAKKSKPHSSKKKIEKKVKAKSSHRSVRHLSEEVKYIKRFVGLHNRKKSSNAILNFLKVLQKSIIQKIISKESPFVKEINFIQDELIRIYNSIEKKKNKEGTPQIPDETLSKLVGIAGGESVYASIGFMKRFIGMQGKEMDKRKQENFLSQLERAVNSKKILSDDPFADRIKKIYSYLKGDYKAGRKVFIEKSELNGLACICKNCDKELGRIYDTKGKSLRKCKSGKYSDAGKGACSYNRGLGKIYDSKGKLLRKCKSGKYSDAKRGACAYNKGLGKVYDTKGKLLRKCKSGKYSDAGRGACSYNKGLSGIMTAEEIVNMKFDLLPFSGTWGNLFGKPEKNFTMMLHGEPGAGKSTFLMKFAKYLTGLGNVLYVSSEEYGSFTLKSLVTKYMSPTPDNIIFTSSINGASLSNYDFVVFDSINDLGLKLEDFKAMKQSNPSTAFIIVLQHTKDGSFKGGKEWEHEIQIAADITEGIISVYKNRYGKKGEWNFFEN